MHGTSRDGFDAEWREISVLTVERDRFSRCELFDEADLDAALARFDQLSLPAPRPENTASQVYDRVNAYFSAGDWAALAQVFAQNMIDDRRRTVNHGMRRGRDAEIANSQAVAQAGADQLTSTVIATRGGRLACSRPVFVLLAEIKTLTDSSQSISTSSNSAPMDGSWRELCLISMTLTPPSPSSTRATSPAKRPPTRARGR